MGPITTAEAALDRICDELTALPPGSSIEAVGGRLELVIGDHAESTATLLWLTEKLRSIAPGIPYRLLDARGEVLSFETELFFEVEPRLAQASFELRR
jgi:hypothetical protein